MTTIRIEHEGIVCEVRQDAGVLDEMLDMCRRVVNGVGFFCGEIEEKD
jgi:hypothetical protein